MTTTPSARVEAAARTMRAQAAGDCQHQVPWEQIPAERQEIWRSRAAEVLAAADTAKQ